MITVNELLSKVSFAMKNAVNGGYSKKQENSRVRYEQMILHTLRVSFPDIEGFNIVNYQGIGYYSCYSDFAISFNGIKLVGIGTHTSTIRISGYKVDLDVFDIDEICSEYGMSVDDFKTQPLDAAVKLVSHHRDSIRAEQLRANIDDAEENIRRWKSELETLNI